MRKAQFWSWGVGVGALALSAFAASADSGRGADAMWVDVSGECVNPPAGDHLADYRLRSSTAFMQASFEDNKRYHFDIAEDLLRRGELSANLMNQLNWTLMRWPNHLPTLRQLTEYAVAGGKPFAYQPAKCYFFYARGFAPDDSQVLIAEAVYYTKLKQFKKAEWLYTKAISLDPEAAEAHYNLGLLYLLVRDYDKAVVQARLAYSAGYPLPGLRRKLAAAGYMLEAAETVPAQ